MTDLRRASSIETPSIWKTNPFGDRYIEALVGSHFELTSATAIYQRCFGNEIFHDDTLYVVAGSDAGLLVRYIVDHGLPKDSRYIFVEIDEARALLNDVEIFKHLNDKIIICNKQDWIIRANELPLANYAYSRKISFVSSVSVQQNSHPEYASLAQAVSQELTHLYWLFTSQFDIRTFVTTQLANLVENRIPAISLNGIFEGNTAIVLAGGPSLDALIPWIKNHRHEALIIAVSRISANLLKAGLEPDIIVSVDPQYISFSVSKEMLNFGDKTLFVHASAATPLLVGQWPHRSAFIGSRLPWNEDGFNNLGTIAPTVTNNAINLAVELGCKQILLAGVDLCYSADGYTHASNTKEHAAGPMVGRINHTVETNSGTRAETNTGYYEAINSIERQANSASKINCKIINLAGSAARIEGVEYCPPEVISIPLPLQQQAWHTISSALDEETPENRKKHCHHILAKIEKAATEIREIKALANEALDLNKRMRRNLNSATYHASKRRMDRIENKLNNRYENMSNAIKRTNASSFANVISASSGDNWSEDDLFNKTELYYQAFIDGADFLITHIDAEKTRARARIEEESNTPDFELLLNQWAHDGQIARGKVWKQRHPNEYEHLGPGIQEKFINLETQFNSIVGDDDAKLASAFQNVATSHNTIGAIMTNAKSAFDKNDVDALQRLVEGLKKRSEPLAQQATLLIQGFMHELKNDYTTASSTYLTIDKEISPELRQIGSERILSYSLVREDYNTALTILNELSIMQKSYQPMHAQLLALTGDQLGAIEVYTKYLKLQPNDLNSMTALGLLLTEVHAKDAAYSTLKLIEEIDPTHAGIEKIASALNGA